MQKKLHSLVSLCLLGFGAFAAPEFAQAAGQHQKPDSDVAALRALLLSELRSTHTQPEWFMPLDAAVGGLTAEQARWVPANASGKLNPNANHSVGMIANHILFWNSNALAQLKGGPVRNPSTNDETFNEFNPANWGKIVHDLDAVMRSLEDLVAKSDDATLIQIAPTIERISTHTAYHTGQIFYVRKLQGSWKQDNDVR